MSQRILQLIDQLANEAFGADWFDFRDRLEAWSKANPAKSQRLVKLVRIQLEEWDR